MAIKKKELYSSLWASCDKLRGGMDASQYKDYILTLLFVKYVTDKFSGERYAAIEIPEGGSFNDMIKLKGSKNIGEGMDIVIATLAKANDLNGVIDNAHFNDSAKLGKGEEMVHKLTGLISIFQRPEFDFSNNKASGDDILGDAYEYLMRKFATESGKSKGQFYTPAEVSRILAQVIGIDKISQRPEGYSIYDPACGSGSLLIRAADEAPVEVSIWGQEKEVTTAGLAKMNFVLHNRAEGVIEIGNTFSAPQYFEDNTDEKVLKRFDFAVANPPFSLKNWMDGMKDYGRFTGYGDLPPEKNGDFAWLLHILKSLKATGKAAVILPHGVLFRGNSEATIRKNIVDRGYIKGIIGLPANLFYGTGIHACIIVIDKSDADERKGIFMIDASNDFIKDGDKNRLRERDIYKIVKTFNEQITSDEKYARFVPNEEIKVKNNYNLSLSRYIDSTESEDLQDIDAHLNGGIPKRDIDTMQKYWGVFGNLKEKLFSAMRDGYYKLNVGSNDIRNFIYNDSDFLEYAGVVNNAFDKWRDEVDDDLHNITGDIDAKKYVVPLSKILIEEFENIKLIDKFDVYEVLLSYWQETMSDDVFLIKYDGYEVGKETESIVETTENKDGGVNVKIKGWDGKLIPKSIIENVYFSEQRKEIDEAQMVAEEAQMKFEAFVEENSGDDGILRDYMNDKNAVDMKALKTRYKKIKDSNSEECMILSQFVELSLKVKETTKNVKVLTAALDQEEKGKYSELDVNEVKELLINRKWYGTIYSGISMLYSSTSQSMANRISELANRYEDTLKNIENEVNVLEKKVKSHFEGMGFEC